MKKVLAVLLGLTFATNTFATVLNVDNIKSRLKADYDKSGCTDIQDFLFLLDNFHLRPNGYIIPMNKFDYRILLNNWQKGKKCPADGVEPSREDADALRALAESNM